MVDSAVREMLREEEDSTGAMPIIIREWSEMDLMKIASWAIFRKPEWMTICDPVGTLLGIDLTGPVWAVADNEHPYRVLDCANDLFVQMCRGYELADGRVRSEFMLAVKGK